jgi:hypothetical protein
MASKRHLRAKTCTGKIAYDTYALATRAADGIGSWNDRGTEAYLCRFCGKFHAGHEPTRGRLHRRDFK